MVEVKLPEIRPNRSRTLEEEVQNLKDTYFMLKKQLDFLLGGNLDEENVIRARSVVADWVYAGQITTDQIVAGEAKISAAMIEDLVVGGNVTMGPNASISWSQVTNRPSIPSQYTDEMALRAWAESDYATYIDANGVYSGSFNGGMFNINPMGDRDLESGLTIGGWYDNGWIGQAFKMQYDPYGSGSFPGTIASSVGGVPLIFELSTYFDYIVDFRTGSTVYFSGNVNFSGADVDFSNATVTGLSAVAVFG